jgi:hypothetical protein
VRAGRRPARSGPLEQRFDGHSGEPQTGEAEEAGTGQIAAPRPLGPAHHVPGHQREENQGEGDVDRHHGHRPNGAKAEHVGHSRQHRGTGHHGRQHCQLAVASHAGEAAPDHRRLARHQRQHSEANRSVCPGDDLGAADPDPQ